MIQFQYYNSDIKKCRPLGFVSLDSFVNAIKNPKQDTKKLFDDIKQAEENKQFELKANLKKQLHKFTPCVVIDKWRNYKNIQSFTGLLVVDYDHLTTEYATRLKTVLFARCKFIIACWLSPSRHGVKALVKIPICQSIEEFKQYFFGIEQAIGNLEGFDAMAQNCVLDLFMGYDPDLLYRTDAETWTHKAELTEKIIKTRKVQEFKKRTSLKRNAPIKVDNLSIVEQVIRLSVNRIVIDGHPQLRAISYTLGGYIGSDLISKKDAIILIYDCIENNWYLSQKEETYKKTALTMIEQGINRPCEITKN